MANVTFRSIDDIKRHYFPNEFLSESAADLKVKKSITQVVEQVGASIKLDTNQRHASKKKTSVSRD